MLTRAHTRTHILTHTHSHARAHTHARARARIHAYRTIHNYWWSQYDTGSRQIGHIAFWRNRPRKAGAKNVVTAYSALIGPISPSDSRAEPREASSIVKEQRALRALPSAPPRPTPPPQAKPTISTCKSASELISCGKTWDGRSQAGPFRGRPGGKSSTWVC